ncbi:MAG: DUF2993 domain-containing protein [Nodosilinea sp.]
MTLPDAAPSSSPELAPDSAPDPAPDSAPVSGSRIIGRLLPPALRLWLQTQLDHIEGLDLTIGGKDRQILSGYVPQVSVAAHRAIYQGLRISQAQVAAKDIRVNLGQVLRGKPLRLLQPFPVQGSLCLLREDVQASLRAPLLVQGLRDLLNHLLQTYPDPDGAMQRWLPGPQPPTLTQIQLSAGQLTLIWQFPQKPEETLAVTTDLAMENGRWLCLKRPVATVKGPDLISSPLPLEEVRFDLGPETDIQRLTVLDDRIELDGTVRVIPAD